MRDPHGYWWVLLMVLAPVGWCMAAGYRFAGVVRDALRKGTR